MIYSIFDSLFLLRPTAKLSHSCACSDFHHRFRNWFLYKMFSIWLCSFQGTSGLLRSLKTIQAKEEYTVIRPAFAGFLGSSPFAASWLPTDSLDSSRSSVSTWNERLGSSSRSLPRKEVIQPHLPIRLPCYDFTPVIGLTFDGWLLAVTSPASGAPNSHGVTGGVYKARERIHRGMLIRDY